MPSLLPGVASIQFLGHLSNAQATSNTIHIANPSAGAPPDFPELQNLADQLYTFLGAAYNNLGTTAWTFDSIIARSVPNPLDPGIPLEAAHQVGTAGTRGTGARQAPDALCGLVFMQTAAASRKFRGHIFAPPGTDSGAFAGNVLDTGNTYWTNLSAWRDKLRAGYATSRTWTGSSLSNYNLVCFSKKAALESLPYVTNVTFVGVRNKASFLRSRERGGT